MSSQPRPTLTPEEYLAFERKALQKSEYFKGEVFAMSGASEQHNLIVANVIASLHVQLKQRPCKVYPSDMRVKVSPTGLYTYPDVVVVCGEVQFDDEQKDTLLNPTLLVEVLSESSEDYDRGKKFEHYRTIPSFVEYVVIAQATPHVEQFTRRANHQWLLSETNDLQDIIQLSSIHCDLTLADIYDKVEFAG